MQTARTSFITGIVIAAAFAGPIAAQAVVVGTGNPDIDVAAVQAAVDRGGSVVLRGHFSFENPPTVHGGLPDLTAMILISKETTISGTWDEHGEMTTITGGEISFLVEAHGAPIRIERLRFVHPKRFAIFVDAVSGLTIESCIVESVDPLPPPSNPTGLTFVSGIYVSTQLDGPNRDRTGNAGNVSGKLSILNNQISVNGTADEGMGITAWLVGLPENPVELKISGNTILNSTQKGINVKQIGGSVGIEDNIIASSVVYTGPARGFISGIHCGGSGSYVVARNRIDVADPNAAGIRLRAIGDLDAPIEQATITDNDVTMSVPENLGLGVRSAGIEIMGLARGNVVDGNRVRGRARGVLSLAPDKSGNPVGNTLARNDGKNLISSQSEKGHQQ
jgi:hypothetical protein